MVIWGLKMIDEDSLLPKRRICEFTLIVAEGPWENYAEHLEKELEAQALANKWCPDWNYTVSPTEEEKVFDVHVYGEIEEEGQ